MSRVWHLVRHGETEWNAIARMQGQLDSCLTERGRAQAAVVGDLLVRLGVDELFASPLGRVRESVAIVTSRLPLPVRYDERLREWCAGDWSGELYADIGGKWPDVWNAWCADRITCRSPNGENFLDLVDRARAFLDDDIATGERVAIIAHGFLNRALATVLLGKSPATMLEMSQRNDTVIRIAGTEVEHFTGADGPFAGLPR